MKKPEILNANDVKIALDRHYSSRIALKPFGDLCVYNTRESLAALQNIFFVGDSEQILSSICPAHQEHQDLH